nr:MAG TPA: hypothetical protein [Caudoviricetes sp.]
MRYAFRFCGVHGLQPMQHYTALRRTRNCLALIVRNM